MALSFETEKSCDKRTEDLSPQSTSPVDLEEGVQGVDSQTQAGQRRPWLARWLSGFGKAEREESPPVEEPEDPYEIETLKVEEIPKGYPKVATFLSSDRNFLQFRGFGNLHCRILADLQYDVERLERELFDLDKWDFDNGKGRKLSSKRRDVDMSPEQMAAEGYPDNLRRSRPKLLTELRQVLKEYDEFLLKSKEIMSLQRPSNQDYESVRTWYRDQNALVFDEGRFIKRKEDIVTLRTGRESAGFDSFVERCLTRVDNFLRRWLRCRIIEWAFLAPELRGKTSSKSIRYYSPARIDKLVNVLITIVVFVLLVLPVIIMYEVTAIGARQSALDAIGVLIVFTLIFGMAISSLTTARRHELFGASAAYAAVLVVFIGNFGVQQVQIV